MKAEGKGFAAKGEMLAVWGVGKRREGWRMGKGYRKRIHLLLLFDKYIALKCQKDKSGCVKVKKGGTESEKGKREQL